MFIVVTVFVVVTVVSLFDAVNCSRLVLSWPSQSDFIIDNNCDKLCASDDSSW